MLQKNHNIQVKSSPRAFSFIYSNTNNTKYSSKRKNLIKCSKYSAKPTSSQLKAQSDIKSTSWKKKSATPLHTKHNLGVNAFKRNASIKLMMKMFKCVSTNNKFNVTTKSRSQLNNLNNIFKKNINKTQKNHKKLQKKYLKS